MFEWNPKANELFMAASQLSDPLDVERFLDEQCGDDDALRHAVDNLIDASNAAGDFLDEPIGPVIMNLSDANRRESAIDIGSTIGRYKVLEEIGEGGFGIVYMAEQREPIRRQVAIKILKHGMDTREVIARFEAERQAIAMMNHPNIAKVLDAGTTNDGRPYFVMELVKGVPLTEFCNEALLTVEDRLDLVVTICRAIQHAHQKGVIHRDIKPSNVLVTMHGDQPVPIGIDVDTRSDVYSLGVLLYELLTDTTPLELERIQQARAAEIAKLVQENDPPTPSTRLSRAGKRLPAVCRRRGSDPKRVTRLIRGDLDWIVMKAIDKDRNRRYESAGNLADDIRRFMDDVPIEARPPTARYRAARFVRRNRFWLVPTFVFVVGLIAGLVGTTIAWINAERTQQSRADENNYVTLIGNAELSLRNGKLNNARSMSDECPVELRGWEWRHLSSRSEPRPFREILDQGFLPGGQQIIGIKTQFASKSIDLFDLDTGTVRPVYKSPDKVRRGVVSRDGSVYAFVEFEEANRVAFLKAFDVKREQVTWRKRIELPIDNVCVSHDGNRIAIVQMYGAVIAFDTRDDSTREFPKNDRGYVAISPDGNHLAVNSNLWDFDSGKLLHELSDGDDTFNSIAFSNDGKTIAKAGFQGTITLWDVETGRKLQSLKGHHAWVAALNFSPDDSMLASGSADATIRLWDVVTGDQLATVGHHEDTVYFVTFNHGGDQIASYSLQNGHRLWDVVTDDVLTNYHLGRFDAALAKLAAIEKVEHPDTASDRFDNSIRNVYVALINLQLGSVETTADELAKIGQNLSDLVKTPVGSELQAARREFERLSTAIESE